MVVPVQFLVESFFQFLVFSGNIQNGAGRRMEPNEPILSH